MRIDIKFVSVSGVSPSDQVNGWKIFPNPSDGHFAVNGNFSELQKLVYQVYTSSRECILTKELPEVESVYETIDLSMYSEGLYLLVLRPEKESSLTRKLIRTD